MSAWYNSGSLSISSPISYLLPSSYWLLPCISFLSQTIWNSFLVYLKLQLSSMVSHGCLSISWAVALLSWCHSNMGIRKSANAYASSSLKRYLSVKTFLTGQKQRPLILRKLPLLSKYFLECLPESARFFGMRPKSSIIYARWSSSLSQLYPFLGSKRKSPVTISKMVHAKLQISADVLQSAPMITSGDLYCLVQISGVK